MGQVIVPDWKTHVGVGVRVGEGVAEGVSVGGMDVGGIIVAVLVSVGVEAGVTALLPVPHAERKIINEKIRSDDPRCFNIMVRTPFVTRDSSGW